MGTFSFDVDRLSTAPLLAFTCFWMIVDDHRSSRRLGGPNPYIDREYE